MTVLFVDDETDVSSYYRKALESRQCLVIFCTSVEDALEKCDPKKYHFKTVILDMMLPWGPYSQTDTYSGLHTGIPLYHDIAKFYPKARYIFLTNLQHTQIPKGSLKGHVEIVNKAEYTPSTFAMLVIQGNGH